MINHQSLSSSITIIINHHLLSITIINHYHHQSLSSSITIVINHYHHQSLSSSITIIINHYHQSLSSITIIINHYRHQSLSSSVTIINHYHQSLSSSFTIVINHYHHQSLSSSITIINLPSSSPMIFFSSEESIQTPMSWIEPLPCRHALHQRVSHYQSCCQGFDSSPCSKHIHIMYLYCKLV